MNRLISFLLVLTIFGMAESVIVATPSGSWSGTLRLTPSTGLELIFNFRQEGKTVTMDVPAQNAKGVPCEISCPSVDSIVISIPQLMISYEAKITADKIYGIFTQGPAKLPLTLSPREKKVARPQTPTAPFPYKEKEVVFTNGNDHVNLSGTLTVPENADNRTPVVLMLSGSGVQNRDEEVFGHKPFAVIADFLARNGIASLRYDDRGCGKSGSPSSVATLTETAGDALAGMEYLRKKEKFRNIGLLGHSEGSNVAFILAGKHKAKPSFIVAMGAPALRGDSVLADQNRIMLNLSGLPENLSRDYADALLKVYAAAAEKGWTAAGESIDSICKGWGETPMMNAMKENLRTIVSKSNDWLDKFIIYSPATDITNTSCPVFVLYGEKDIQVSPKINMPAMHRLAPKAEIRQYSGLNHLMQHAKTGAVSEYAEIEETISPEVLSDITDFIRKQ